MTSLSYEPATEREI